MPFTLKPGYKTSEAWIVVLTNVALVVSAAADWLPPRYAAIGSAISTAAYAIARGLAKLNPPKAVEPVPGAPVPPAPPVQ